MSDAFIHEVRTAEEALSEALDALKRAKQIAGKEGFMRAYRVLLTHTIPYVSCLLDDERREQLGSIQDLLAFACKCDTVPKVEPGASSDDEEPSPVKDEIASSEDIERFMSRVMTPVM